MPAETLLSYDREAWVIPNAHGRLWTDTIFDREDDAKAYLAKNWPGGRKPPKKVMPVLALVTVSAVLVTTGGIQ